MELSADILNSLVSFLPSIAIVILVIVSNEGNDYFTAFFIALIQSIMIQPMLPTLLQYVILLVSLLGIYSMLIKLFKALKMNELLYLILILVAINLIYPAAFNIIYNAM